MRDTVFISHATPEDNNFTIWLASRLQLLGYKVWIDKSGLLGGEKFWEDIDQVIRNEAIKFLLVYSNNICQQQVPGKLKDGIYKEISLAESIGKQHGLSDFMMLLNVDGAYYNLFIGADRLNQVPFYENWAEGLKQVLRKLEKDNVPKAGENQSGEFGHWFQNEYTVPNPILAKKELYYSNIWPINELPKVMYIHKFSSEEQAKFIADNHKKYPLSRIANYVSSFEGDLLYGTDGNDQDVLPEKIHTVYIRDILGGYESSSFPTAKDSANHFKALLKKAFHLIMKNRGMFWFEMANRRLAYFYTPANLSSLKVRFSYPFRKSGYKTKNLLGIYKKTQKWHYAVSVKPVMFPLVGFSLKSHLTFTTDGFQVWKNEKGEMDKTKIQSHRRSKGKMLFNEEWRDMFLGFLHGLKKEDKIELELSGDFVLRMSPDPDMYWSTFGYFDPKDKTRHGILAFYDDEEDGDEEIKTEDVHE